MKLKKLNTSTSTQNKVSYSNTKKQKGLQIITNEKNGISAVKGDGQKLYTIIMGNVQLNDRKFTKRKAKKEIKHPSVPTIMAICVMYADHVNKYNKAKNENTKA